MSKLETSARLMAVMAMVLLTATMVGCGGDEPVNVEGTGEPVTEVHYIELAVGEEPPQSANIETTSGQALKEWVEQNILARRGAASDSAEPRGRAVGWIRVTDDKSNVEDITIYSNSVVLSNEATLPLSAAQQIELGKLMRDNFRSEQ